MKPAREALRAAKVLSVSLREKSAISESVNGRSWLASTKEENAPGARARPPIVAHTADLCLLLVE